VLTSSLELREAPGGSAGGSAPEALGVPEGRAEPKPTDAAGREATLVCAACRNPITHARDAIEVNGAHSQAFVNPAGMIFRVRCFSAAPGAAGLGEESQFWTWFPGFLWQAAVCRRCFGHLGWRYRNSESTFFGLIAERLLELEPPGAPPEPS
jgi:hypothetical protein